MELPEIKVPKGFKVLGGEVIYSGRYPSCSILRSVLSANDSVLYTAS